MRSVQLLFIEAEGKLFRGYGREYPLIEWWPRLQQWDAVQNSPKLGGSSERLSLKEAERCYPGSTTVALPKNIDLKKKFSVEEYIQLQPELFDYYDGRITRYSPEENERSRKALHDSITRVSDPSDG